MRTNEEWFFDPNFPKGGFWGWSFVNLTHDLESAFPRYHVCQFSGKTDNIDFFGPNLAKNEFRGRKFENLDPGLE